MLKATLDALALFPEQLEQFFYTIPQSHWLWMPESWAGIPSESFTALEQLCHVRDIEVDGYQTRIQRIVDEIEPSLSSIDGYALAQSRHYAAADPEAVFTTIRLARKKTLSMIHNLNQVDLERKGILEGYGSISLCGLIHFLCSHDQQHLSGMQWLRGKTLSL